MSAYLHAKTRYGNDSMRVIMVDSADWQPLSDTQASHLPEKF